MYLFWFLCAKAATALAHLSHRNSVCLSVCPSVYLSHGWVSQKRCKQMQIFTVSCLEDSSLSPVLVVIGSMPMVICNHFHERLAISDDTVYRKYRYIIFVSYCIVEKILNFSIYRNALCQKFIFLLLYCQNNENKQRK